MATNTHIMKLADVEKAADELHTPSLSKMMFERRFKNPALFWLWDRVQCYRCLKVCKQLPRNTQSRVCGRVEESRAEGEHSKEVVKPYDWTYATDYEGMLLGESLK